MRTLTHKIKFYLKQYRIHIIALLVCGFVGTFGFLCFQAFFYVKNGGVVDLEYYYVEPPFPKWYIRIKNEFRYILLSDKNDEVVFFRQLDEPDELNPDLVLKLSRIIDVYNKTYADVNGTIYVALNKNNNYTIYFLSSDLHFYLLMFPDSLTEENEKYLDLLLNSVKKKPNV
jgi:hypothetical protein